MRREHDTERSKYPLFKAFGDPPPTLSEADEPAASFDARVASIWMFAVKLVVAFAKTLKPQERSVFSPEDFLMELWVKLREKDSRWEPARGRYITFAGRIIGRELSSLRDKTRTVASPRNSTGRLKEYQAEADAGTITRTREKTFGDIRRTLYPTDSMALAPEPPRPPSDAPPLIALAAEDAVQSRDAMIQALRSLSIFEARVMGESCGLWGQPMRTAAEIAARSGRTLGEVRRARDRARIKMRDRLEDLGHPAARGDDRPGDDDEGACDDD